MHQMIFTAARETIFMLLVAGFATIFIGLPVGIFLSVTDKDSVRPLPFINSILKFVIYTATRVPFLLLMIVAVYLWEYTFEGSKTPYCSVFAIALAGSVFYTAWVSQAIDKIPNGIKEMSVYGGTPLLRAIRVVLIPEAKVEIIQATSRALVYILSCSVIAGAVNSEGLGRLALEAYASQNGLLLIPIPAIVLLLTVFIQSVADYLAE